MTAAVVALRRPPPDPRQLQRCLLLAVLLHIWLVLVFGNAAGSAAPGQGVWGSLTVKLLGRSGSDAGAPPSEAPQAPGATEQGRWNPRQVPPEAARTDQTSPAPPSTATLDLPEGFQPVERQTPDTPAPRQLTANESPVLPMTPAESLKAAQPAPLLPPVAELPAAPGRLEARPETSITPLQRPAELRLPGSTTPAAVAAPSPDLPAAVRRLEAPTENAVAPLQRPAELRAPSTTAAAPVTPASADLPAAVRRLEAPAADGTVTALPRASELRPAPATPTAAAAAPSSRDLPAPVRRLEAAHGGATVPVTPLQAATGTRPAPASTAAQALPELSNALPGQVAAPAAAAGPARGDPAADAFAAPKASAGTPEAGPRLGPNLPPLPATAAASAPRAPLNLSLPRGDMAAKRSPGLVELLPTPPERKSKLEQSIEDAANKDCRKAYSNAGILAVVPLAIDAARGKGCNW